MHCKSSKGIPAPPTLDLALATGTEKGAEILEGSTPTTVLGSPESSDLLTMTARKGEKKKNSIFSSRRHRRPRPLPLFARPEAGHVVFRGNEVLDQQ